LRVNRGKREGASNNTHIVRRRHRAPKRRGETVPLVITNKREEKTSSPQRGGRGGKETSIAFLKEGKEVSKKVFLFFCFGGGKGPGNNFGVGRRERG